MSKWLRVAHIVLFLSFAGSLSSAQKPLHKDLRIKDERFAKLLKDSPDLFDFGGVRLGKLKDGSVLLMGVGYTSIKNSSPRDKIRQLTVSAQKAKAALVAYLKGPYVKRIQNLEEETATTSSEKEDLVEMRSLYNETILTKAKGRLGAGLRPAATWKSPDGLVFFQAMGYVIPDEK